MRKTVVHFVNTWSHFSGQGVIISREREDHVHPIMLKKLKANDGFTCLVQTNCDHWVYHYHDVTVSEVVTNIRSKRLTKPGMKMTFYWQTVLSEGSLL